jgi:hypothetical protein
MVVQWHGRLTRLLKSGFYLESLGGFRESNRRIES